MTDWLVTSTFYGQRIPGDPRGSITNVRDRRPGEPEELVRIEHALLGEPFEEAIPGLHRAAALQLKERPIEIELAHAEQLLEQFQETAAYRGWTLLAVSVMFDHIHLVVSAPTEAGKLELLRDFKSYGSRRLNRVFGKRVAETWWTESGSCRPIRLLAAVIFYVCHRQPNPLLIWSSERGRIPPSESHPDNEYHSDSHSEPPA
jgi:REP element-mobilizing transposase RayT